MSTKSKLAAAAVALIVLVTGWWSTRGGPELAAGLPSTPAAPSTLAAAAAETPAEPIARAPTPERTPLDVETPPSAVALTALGSLRVHAHWFDGSPAQEVRVLVEPNWSEEGPSPKTRYGRTDAEGAALLEELPAGDALVTLDRGEGDVAKILAGREAELTLTIPRGFDVTGVVLDPSGRPVPAADVWASRMHVDEGLVLAQTDAEGRFALRSVTSGFLGARARGFAPSLCEQMFAGEGAELAFELVLMGPGGALEGTVRDPDGLPLANAWVAAGLDHPLGQVHMLPVGGTKECLGVLSGPIETRTDAEGRYRIDGLAPGTRRMAVRASGFGAWRGEVEVVENGTRRQDVNLERGVTVVGQVLLADGRPARASLEVDDPLSMLATRADTDEEGRFELAGLAAGELHVHADGGRKRGDARTTLHGQAGETLTWDARLVMGGSITGRAIDEQGAPLVGWSVQVEDDPHVPVDYDLDFAETNADGAFTLLNLHDRPHRVTVHAPTQRSFPVATANGVRPGPEELLLVVESAAVPSASIVGRVLDELGRPADGAQLVLARDRLRGGRQYYPDPTGAFALGPLAPGKWLLRIDSPELAGIPAVVLGPRELGVGEAWDCGTVVLGKGGSLVVTVRDLRPGMEPAFSVLRECVFPLPLQKDGETWRAGPLQAGAYRLQVSGPALASAQIPFEIRASDVTRLEVALAPGTTLPIRAHVAAASEQDSPQFRVRDEHGALVLEADLWLHQDEEGNAHLGDYGAEIGLAPGRYDVEVWLENGPRATATVHVEAGEAEPLALELR